MISRAASIQPSIIVDTERAARQWELHLAEPRLAGGETVWRTPPIASYRAWTQKLWHARRPDAAAALLNGPQCEALWREIVANSPEGSELLGSTGIARWARDARRRLISWRLHTSDPKQATGAGVRSHSSSSQVRRPDRSHRTHAGTDSDSRRDFEAFLCWHREYEDQLQANHWIDPEGVEGRLPDLPATPPEHCKLADGFEATPMQEFIFRHLENSDWTIGVCSVPPRTAIQRQLGLPDASAELHEAACWARWKLEQLPGHRIAIVVPTLTERMTEARDRFEEEGVDADALYFDESGQGGAARPLVGAALNALLLLSPRGGFVELSRWLRSPFFGVANPVETAAAARIESRLREGLVSQIPFVRAWFEAGLGTQLHEAVPVATAHIDEALRALGPSRDVLTPSQWGQRWQRALHLLAWAALDGADKHAEDLRVWEYSLRQFALLTPIIGRISLLQALAEFRRIVDSHHAPARMPTTGVHVFEDLESIGPGYESVWITGLTAATFPRSVSLNPLLPRALQVDSAMPWATPSDCLARSRQLLARLQRQVGELVVSWPLRETDNEAEPSPLLREFADGSASAPSSRPDRPHVTRTAGLRRRETLEEPLVRALDGKLRGGTRALNATACCPLRAFCEFRLGASGLTPMTRGIPSRLKGIALHEALELFYRRRSSQDSLNAVVSPTLDTEIDTAATKALDHVFGEAKSSLPQLFDLERRRMTRLMRTFIEREISRTAFTVLDVERTQTFTAGPWWLTTRIDRVDQLDDDTLAIIDYKSGGAPTLSAWFDDRPTETQLPLYAVATAGRISALVIASLTASRTSYAGHWSNQGDFPGRALKLPDERNLQQQIDTWRQAMESLTTEFAQGETTIFPDEIKSAESDYAPLTRIREQLALHYGWIASW